MILDSQHYTPGYYMVSPMLAKKYLPDKHNVIGWYASEKLDGVRAIFDGKSFWTRNGNRLDAPYHFTASLEKLPLHGRFLDGELYISRGRFNECSGIVRRHGDEWWGIEFHVFDLISERDSFAIRNDDLRMMIEDADIPHLIHVEQDIVKCLDELSNWHNEITRQGGEGIMLKNPQSMYEQKRSSHLLKMKDFHEAEYTCVGIENGKGKYNGMIGALVLAVGDTAEKTFTAGSGLNDHERSVSPHYFIGQKITVKYFELSKDGIPRFPIYKGIRTDK